ncbi:hypothetical protein G9A89_008503 [Geosiphon pyriformis]|nr:hypothetical protein G9A89_008503 [Geosiphon pyriformis]
MPEHMHDTDAGFDLKYSGKNAIKLEPHLCTCVDLKVVLEILTTTMIQLVSKSSLVKKEINIKEKIIDAGYVGNIIAMLQNNSEKIYIIEPNEKIQLKLSFETEEESYQTAPVFDFLSSKSDLFTQTVTPEPMANDPMQANILATL